MIARSGFGEGGSTCLWRRLRALLKGLDHFLDRSDPRDRFRRKGERVGDGVGELNLKVDGATAHAGYDAGFLERSPGEAPQNDRLFRRDVSKTPRISTWNWVTLSPANTVRPVPFIPGLICSSGKKSAAMDDTASRQKVRSRERTRTAN